jgi:gliding motility-associated-like protein
MKNFYFLFFFCNTLFAQTLINEYSAANYSDYTDNYGDYEDWFELYNTGESPQDLTGFYLSDKANNLTKFQISSPTLLNGNSHLRIFASGRDEENGSDIHTNFKIHQTKGNEWIILTAADGITIIDSVFVKPCLTNHSRGRLTDGDEDWGVFTTASPSNSNNNALERYAIQPIFSVQPGFYPSNISLEITSTEENSEIYYTTDGSYPNNGSILYTGPLTISETSVIKAIAVSSNNEVLNSFMEYGTFFINDTYTMPVLSVSGNDLDVLLGGIQFVPLGTFEYYKQNGELADKARGEFNEHGNDSWAYDQRGFDYITRDQLGYNYAIKDELFRTKDRDKYQRLIIKAAANDNYPFAYGGSGAHIRDSYVQSLSQIADLRMDERSFEPCVMFLNGEYWGLYEIREKVDDKDFTDYYYDQDSVAFLKTWANTWADVLSNGQTETSVMTDWDNIRDFITNNDMSDPANYDYAKSVYNMGSLIDYFILNTYVVNADWLNYNTGWWHGLKEDGDKKKWRYILWDMDNTFDHGANYTQVPSQNPNADPCNPEGLGDEGGQGHIPIWNALLDNDEFFADYINRWTDLSNSYFSCDFLIGHLDSLIDIIEPEMPAQIEKWGGNYNTWQNNVQDMRDFITTRCEMINGGILDCYEDEYGIEGPYDVTVIIEPPLTGEINMNGFDLTESPFTGTYFGGITQEVEAFAVQDYSFDYWEFSNGTATNSTNSTLEYTLSSNQTITAHFTPNNTLILTNENEGSISVNGVQYSSFPDTIAVSQTITIEANPDDGFLFDTWIITNGTIDNPYDASTTATINGDAVIIATYIPYPVLTINSVPNGSIQIDGNLYDNLPESINIYGNNSILAIPETGYQFDYWEYNGSFISNFNSPSTSIDILSNASLTAQFSKIEFEVLFDISHIEGGEIYLNNELITNLPASKTLLYGDNYSIHIELTTNYLLNYWEVFNTTIPINTLEDFDISFTQADTIIAHLDHLYSLTLTVEPDGAGIVLGNGEELQLAPYNQLYYENTLINLEAIPEIDKTFEHFARNQTILNSHTLFDYTIEYDDTLRVIFSEKELSLYIPNSFTPNGDNLNDVFKPVGIADKIKDYEMLIFNGWGELVFESHSIENGWDAKNINYSSSTVFIYKITLHSSITNDKFEYKGTLLVL